jgi:putative transposase
MMDYDEERPHESLDDLPSAVYRQLVESSTLELSH